jgi:hypothetical protein
MDQHEPGGHKRALMFPHRFITSPTLIEISTSFFHLGMELTRLKIIENYKVYANTFLLCQLSSKPKHK